MVNLFLHKDVINKIDDVKKTLRQLGNRSKWVTVPVVINQLIELGLIIWLFQTPVVNHQIYKIRTKRMTSATFYSLP